MLQLRVYKQMTIDQQIEFYWREHQAAKTKSMALVAFGAYMALVKLRSGEEVTLDDAALPLVKPMDEQIKLAAARAAIRNVVIP
jgi:hypothetical protein